MKLIFSHVVKTGGSTLSRHFKNNLPTFIKDRDFKNDIDIKKADIVCGHDISYKNLFDDQDKKYMTILRDPADWALSCYNHDMTRCKTNIDFKNWLAVSVNSIYPLNFTSNRMYHYIRIKHCWQGTKQDVIDYLKNAWFVGVTKYLDEDIPRISKALGIPSEYKNYRISGEFSEIDNYKIENNYKMPGDIRHKIYCKNEIDLELYNLALDLRKRKINEIKLCKEHRRKQTVKIKPE